VVGGGWAGKPTVIGTSHLKSRSPLESCVVAESLADGLVQRGPVE
jgi:hypothetical protein